VNAFFDLDVERALRHKRRKEIIGVK